MSSGEYIFFNSNSKLIYEQNFRFCFSEEKLQNYLFKHLKSFNQTKDPDGSGSRLVVSHLAGNGKSLVVSNLTSSMTRIVTQIHTQNIEYADLVQRLFTLEPKSEINKPVAYQFDFACQGTKCKDDLIFALCILRGITNPKTGALWLASNDDYYLIELTLPIVTNEGNLTNKKRKPISITDIIPKITCLSPRQSLEQLQEKEDRYDLIQIENKAGFWHKGFDSRKFSSSQFPRPFFHLKTVSFKDND